MHSIHRALLWELTARGWWLIPLYFVIGSSLPLLVNAALSHAGLPWTEPIWIVLQLGLLPFLLIASSAGIMEAYSNASRLYAMPISNRSIALWHIIPGAVILGLQVATFSLGSNFLFHANWPVAGPSLAAAACWALFQPLYHGERRTLLSIVLLMIPIVLLSLWVHSRYGGWFSKPSHPWDNVTATELLTLLGFAVFAYAEFRFVIQKSRCGERILAIEPWLTALKESWTYGKSVPKKFIAFRSPSSAQFWYQWRQKGMALPYMYLVFLATLGTAMTIKFYIVKSSFDDLEDFRKVIVIFGLYIIGISGLAGFFFAISNIRSSNNRSPGLLADGLYIYDLCSFQSTKPISSTLQSYALLKTCGLSVFITWGCWVASVLLISGLAWLCQKPFASLLPENFGYWLFPMVLILSWIALTTVTLVGVSGRGTNIILSGAAIIALYVVFSIAIGLCFRNETVEALQRIAACLMCVFAIAYCIATTVQSLRSELISKATAGTMFAACIAIVIATFAVAPRIDNALSLLATIAMACLAVQPLSAFPLAFATNRTR